MKSFWDIIASVANSIIFLLVGLEINNVHFNRGWLDITIAIVIVLVSRSISVYISLLFTKGIPSKWQHLINWGGLKGSLSLVLALSLPSQFEMRDELIVITFATVIFSILVQGLTVGPLIKWLDLGIKREGITEYEEKSARYQLVKTALSELKSEYNQSLINKEVYDLKKEKYEEQERQLQKEINQLFERYPEIKEEQLEDLKRLILYRQFDKLKQLESKELIGETISQKIQLEIIEEIEKIDSKNEH
jgi:CPA1 family monovalent cation:H+ antiporter